MGLFGNKKDLARGTARVVSTTAAPQATHSSIKMDLVVEVVGIPAYSHSYRKRVVAIAKWPSPGDVLPVTVDRNDTDDVEVMWDEVPTTAEVARLQSEQLAASLRGETTSGDDVADIVSSLQQMFPGAVVDVSDGAPIVATTGVVNVVASQSNADPVERLEKLAKLRAAGIVDDAQFAQLRAQILEQAGLD